jgi:hypothetical protein
VINHGEDEPDLEKVLIEANRVLRPGGRMVVLNYGTPTFADEHLNQVMRWAHCLGARGADDLMERCNKTAKALGVMRGNRVGEAPVARCKTDLTGMLGYLSRSSVMARLEHVYPELAEEILVRLRLAWGSASTKREMGVSVRIGCLQTRGDVGACRSGESLKGLLDRAMETEVTGYGEIRAIAGPRSGARTAPDEPGETIDFDASIDLPNPG